MTDKLSLLIGEWVKVYRKKQGISTAALADKVRMSGASISRVETGKASVTALFLFRLLNGLGLPFYTLIEQGFIPTSTPEPTIHFKKNITTAVPSLTLVDLEAYAKLPVEIQMAIVHDYHAKYAKESYGTNITLPKDTNGLFSLLPGPSNYITDIDIETLRNLAGADGVLITKDIGAYIYKARKQIGYSLRDASERLRLSYTGVYKLEKKHGDRINFTDIVDLDDALETQGELIAFAWLAFKSHDQVLQWKENPGKDADYLTIMESLITVTRLYQYFLPEDVSWLELIRKAIYSY